ncbi:ASKHA domain-containing protein, partial [Desulfovibrio sp. OttesenSCG-928-C06]|nr:ASKHA domain-containing protein [Desulfovibrio sp. OttesenSCG-928-C06]
SRLAFAAGESGRERLRAVSLMALQRIFNDAGNSVAEMVVAANPAMAHLILGRDAAGLRAAPYHLDYLGGAGESLSGLPPLWLCPLISPFVGGDISAGYAFLAYGQEGSAAPAESLYPFLLADLGTNGEFLLALDENSALAVSLPLGPALEGMGMSCGAEARNSSGQTITSFTLGPHGPQPDGLPPGAVPSGISATGYLSLLHNLLRLGLLDDDGLFVTDSSSISSLAPLSRKAAEGFRVHNGETAWFFDDSLYVSATDVEELLKVKASFQLALEGLLSEAGLTHGGLRRVYLAGNLGLHVDTGDLAALGFVPELLRGRIVPVGNSSLAGAELLAARKDLREPLCRWAAGVRTLDLTAAPGFHTLFASAMNFR